jgi:hypothetical protein
MFATQFLNQGSRGGAGTGPVPTTIQIGTVGNLGSDTSLGKAPFAYAYDHSWAAWIIEASELAGASGSITSIELYMGTMSDATYTMNTQRIWTSHIGSRSSFSGNLPIVDFAGYSDVTNRTQCKVFDVTFNTNDEGTWMKFNFITNNFQWNGVDNIAFEWLNKDGSYNFGGPNFHIDNKSGSVAYRRRDGTYPAGQTTFLDSERPIMKINFNEGV